MSKERSGLLAYLPFESWSPGPVLNRVERRGLSKGEAFWMGVEALRQTPIREEKTGEVLEKVIPEETLHRLLKDDERLISLYRAGLSGQLEVELESGGTLYIRNLIDKYFPKKPLGGEEIFIESVREILEGWDDSLADPYWVRNYGRKKGERVKDYLRALDEASLTVQEKRVVWGYLFTLFFQELMWERIKPSLLRYTNEKTEVSVAKGQEENYFLRLLQPGVYFQGWTERIQESLDGLMEEVFGEKSSEVSRIIEKAILTVERKKPSRPDLFLRDVLRPIHRRNFEEAKEKLV